MINNDNDKAVASLEGGGWGGPPQVTPSRREVTP